MKNLDTNTLLIGGAIAAVTYFLTKGNSDSKSEFKINATVTIPGYGNLPAHEDPATGQRWVLFHGNWILFSQLEQIWLSQQQSGTNQYQQMGQWLWDNSGQVINILKDLGIIP